MSNLMSFYMFMLAIFGGISAPVVLVFLFIATKAKLQGGDFFKTLLRCDEIY
ncbi:MAG: hypothetical protein HRU04_06990 [Oceanospirillaceae bacterium]|nr:hypothetical protein [Oceanospirillaceae bacterium]